MAGAGRQLLFGCCTVHVSYLLCVVYWRCILDDIHGAGVMVFLQKP